LLKYFCNLRVILAWPARGGLGWLLSANPPTRRQELIAAISTENKGLELASVFGRVA
jgi:hypothetical protein